MLRRARSLEYCKASTRARDAVRGGADGRRHSERNTLLFWLTERCPARCRAIGAPAVKQQPIPPGNLRADEVPSSRRPAHPGHGVESPLRCSTSSIGPDDLRARADELLAQPEIPLTRNNKTYDLRPLIVDLSVDGDGSLVARLVTGDRGNGRADELLDALGLDLAQARIHRRQLVLDESG